MGLLWLFGVLWKCLKKNSGQHFAFWLLCHHGRLTVLGIFYGLLAQPSGECPFKIPDPAHGSARGDVMGWGLLGSREQELQGCFCSLKPAFCSLKLAKRVENGQNIPLWILPLEIQNFPLPERWRNWSLEMGCSLYPESVPREEPSPKVLGRPKLWNIWINHILNFWHVFPWSLICKSPMHEGAVSASRSGDAEGWSWSSRFSHKWDSQGWERVNNLTSALKSL